MQAGRLDRRIIIQQNIPTFNTFGGEVETWSVFSTVWANVKEKGGSEIFDSDQTAAVATTIFSIRFLDAVTERMRISYNGVIYDIESIIKIGRNDRMEITTTINNPS